MASANLAMAQPPPAPPPRSYTDLFGDPIYDLTPLCFKNDLFLPPDFDSEPYISNLQTFKVRTLRHSSISASCSSFFAQASTRCSYSALEKEDASSMDVDNDDEKATETSKYIVG